MLTRRIIPCLDCRDGRVVKGVRFAGLRDAGDPVEMAAAYEAQGADEIVLLDVSATPDGRRHQLDTVRAVRRVLSIPLSVGGGVRGADDASALLEAGADKVGVNTAAVRDPALLGVLAERFGCQCVILAIDAAERKRRNVETSKRRNEEAIGQSEVEEFRSEISDLRSEISDLRFEISDLRSEIPNPQSAIRNPQSVAAGLEYSTCPTWEVVVQSGRERTGVDAVAWAIEGVRRGAGEILLTSWDRDGTRSGYDLDLLRAVSSAVRVPVIASGGAAHAGHLIEALHAGADAVLAAGIFHDGTYTVAQLKGELAAAGVEVRP